MNTESEESGQGFRVTCRHGMVSLMALFEYKGIASDVSCSMYVCVCACVDDSCLGVKGHSNGRGNYMVNGKVVEPKHLSKATNLSGNPICLIH